MAPETWNLGWNLVWNLEPETWNLVWNLEPETWNLKPGTSSGTSSGTWNLKPETSSGTWIIARRTKQKRELALVTAEREDLLARRAGRRRVAAVVLLLALALPLVALGRDTAATSAAAVAASALLFAAAAASLFVSRAEREREALLVARIRDALEATGRIDAKLDRARADVTLPLAERRVELEAELAFFAAESERLQARVDRWHLGREMTRLLTAPLVVAALVGVLAVKACASTDAALGCALVFVLALGAAAWQDRRRLLRQAHDVANRTRATEAVIRGIRGALPAAETKEKKP